MKHFRKRWGKFSKAMVQLIPALVMMVALVATAIPAVGVAAGGDAGAVKSTAEDLLIEDQGAADVDVLDSDSSRISTEYELGDEEFEVVEIGDLIVRWHQRMIGDAIVEGDYIVYQFDKNTGALLKERRHWREDLAEYLPPAIGITEEQAESMVRGEVQYTRLYIISPESDVFPLEPTPENPCWVVTSVDSNEMIDTIIDSVDGEILGYGVPPPYTGFSLSGPQYFSPCSGTWTSWYKNAESWFNTMGYPTEAVQWPTEAKVQSHVQSTDTAMFYELAHGGSFYFKSGCVGGNDAEYTYSSEIETWIAAYTKMPFAFIGSCEGMCDTTDGTFSYEFRKGSTEDTATVGYCGMSSAHCDSCWTVSVSWQDALFDYMDQGYTVKAAFEQAQADYPQCASSPSCMRFAGDTSFAVVPVVERAPTEPDILVNPTSLETTLVQDTTGQLPLNIANVGDAPLQVYTICDEETGTASVAVAPSDNPSGNPDEDPVAGEPVFLVSKVESAAADDNQPAPATPAIKEGRSVPGSDVGDAPQQEAATSVPMWERLQALDQAEKQNAVLQLEVASDLDAATMAEVRNIEALWNSGAFAEAIESLKAVETGGLAVAAGISWKNPKPAGDIEPASDVRIGTRDHITEQHLDFDAETGNLFAVLRFYDSDSGYYCWSINISTDGGQTWQETFEWSSGYEIEDTSAAVVDDYLYVGYVGWDGTFLPQEARLRRALVSNGAIDTSYGWVTVFDKGVDIREIALCTNADDWDNRVYYWAILANNSLVHFWCDQNGVSWYEASTGVTDAWQGLDATWNEGYLSGSGYYLFASYLGSGVDHPVVVLRCDGVVWEAIEVLPVYTGLLPITSVSAYNDTVICMYEHDFSGDNGIRYNISYNGGDTWGSLNWPPPAGHHYYKPDVTARGGAGTACVFSEEAGVFDPVWFSFRAGYSGGGWSVLEQINEIDCFTGYPNRIEYVPPSPGYTHGYGAIYLSGGDLAAYFDRTDVCVCVDDAPWMSLSPTSGTVNPDDDMDVTVSFNASGLSPGTYEGNIKISSNDPDEGCTLVPVTLTVKGIPDIDVTPTSLEITLGPDTTGQLTSNVANVGNGLLQVYDICDEETAASSVAGKATPVVLDGTTPATSEPVAEGQRSPDVVPGGTDIYGDPAVFDALITQDFTADVGRDAAGNPLPAVTSYWDGRDIFSTGVDMDFSSPDAPDPTLVTVHSPTHELGPVGPGGEFWCGALRYDFDVDIVAVGFATFQLGPVQVILLNRDGTTLSTTSWDAGGGGGFIGIIDERGFASVILDTDNCFWSMGEVRGQTTGQELCQCGADASWMSVSPTSGMVDPGDDMDVTVDFDASGLTEGTYEGNIKISSNDPDEGCVVVPVTLTVIAEAKPDLVIDDIWTVPASFGPGDNVEIWVRVCNIGSAPAEGLYATQFYLDGTPIFGYAGQDPLNPGDCYELHGNRAWPSDCDPHEVRVLADSNNTVAESDETNNDRTESFSADCRPDLVISEKWEEPANPRKYLHPPKPIDPRRPIEEPVSTDWHELYPEYCNEYHLSEWKDNGDEVLSPCDYIVLEDGTGAKAEYHVDEMTVTIAVLPEKAELMYLDFVGGYKDVERAIYEPVCTYWHIVYPEFCDDYHLAGWKDNGDKYLSADDSILLVDVETGRELPCDVEEMTWDIIVSPVKPEPRCTYLVNYTVTNQGDATAPAGHSTTLYVDGNLIEHKVVPVALRPKESYTDTFRTVVTCSPPVDAVEVCADNFNQVRELDEKNNCLRNDYWCGEPSVDVQKKVWDPEAGKWVEEVTAAIGDTVRFRCTIHNDATCCDLTRIVVTDILSESLEYADNATVDGKPWEPVQVGPSEFVWEFPDLLLEPGQTITIEFDARVVACGEDTNLQMADAWCAQAQVHDEDTATVIAVGKPDLIVTKIRCDRANNRIGYEVKNIGCDVAPAGHCTALYVGGAQMDTDEVPINLNYGDTYEGWFEKYEWPYCHTLNDVRVCADTDNNVDESDETNNCKEGGCISAVLEWTWNSTTVEPEYDQVMMAPVVADLNGDNIPDVIFSTFSKAGGWQDGGILRAISGDDGHELFSVTNLKYRVSAGADPAVADIDNDGLPEIVVIKQGGEIICFENDGTWKWTSSASPDRAGIAVADLDEDGTPEIIAGRTAFNNDGTLRWTGTSGTSHHPVVANLDLDGHPEVVVGNAAYRYDGSIYWTSTYGGTCAIANFDDDPYPEIVVVGGDQVCLKEHDGTLKWGPVAMPGGGGNGAPVVADIDGDGELEIGVGGYDYYVAFETDGSIKWMADIRDHSSRAASSSAFDFDGDGSSEIIYSDELYHRIFRGSDGVVLFETPGPSGTMREQPIIVDVDNDGHVEIVLAVNNYAFPGNTGIEVYGNDECWPAARCIWNQHSYHITNINDDATVPQVETNNWEVFNNYREQSPEIGICGDVDCDGKVTMNDGRQIFMNLIYGPEKYPICDPWAADCDGMPGLTMNDGRQIFMNLIYGPEKYPLQCR